MEELLRDAGILIEGSLYEAAMSRSCITSIKPCARINCSSAIRTTSSANGEVEIIDEYTGRMMPGRRYSEGLHQAP